MGQTVRCCVGKQPKDDYSGDDIVDLKLKRGDDIESSTSFSS